MDNVIQFPDKMSDRMTEDSEGLVPLLGVPHLDMFAQVVMANEDMFEFLDCMTVAEKVELFLDPKYPATVLADIEDLPGVENAKGLYSVDLTTYRLVKLSDCPLVHFK
jgi:hypothetical protein